MHSFSYFLKVAGPFLFIDALGNIFESCFLAGKIQLVSLSFVTLNKKCLNLKKILFNLLWYM